MKKYSELITPPSFHEGTGTSASDLTTVSGSEISRSGSMDSTDTSLTSDNRKPSVLNNLPDYYNKVYSTLKIGMCQVYTEEWAVQANIRRTLEAIDLASEQGAEIAVTPECVFHGYPIDETKGKSESFRRKLFTVAETPDSRNLKLFKDKAIEKGIYILVGFVEKGEGGHIHNSAALIAPDGQFVYIYRKVHCRNFENINYWGYFSPGEDFFTAGLQIKGRQYNVGTIICFDREIPESLRCMRSLGAELVLCPLATDTSDMSVLKNETDNEIITRVQSTCNELFIVVVNHAGRFNGGSFITGPKGELLCQMNADPGVLTFEMPLGIISQEFHNDPLGWMGWGYRRPEVYKKYI